MYSYSNLITDLDSVLENKTSAVTNLRSAINRLAREVTNQVDLKSLVRKTFTARAVYDDVYLYPLAADMKMESLIDIVKYKDFDQGSNTNLLKVPLRVFNSNFEADTFAFDYYDGIDWLKANISNDDAAVTINKLDSLTDNGTFTATDDATNISLNEINYISGTGAIGVDLSPAGTTLSISNSTQTAVDLSDITKLFYWVYLPSGTKSYVSTIGLRYGSDSSNYKATTATTPFNLDSLVDGWNFIAFDLGTATGSPTLTAVDYLKLYITFSSTPSTLTGFIFDNVLAAKGEPYELQYYSKYPWKNTSGTYIQNSTANEDTLVANEEDYDVIFNHIANGLGEMIPVSTERLSYLRERAKQSRTDYQLKYPSQRKKVKLTY